MLDVSIRSATVADAHAIARIHVASWQDAYSQLLSAEYLNGLSVEERTRSWAGLLEANQLHVSVAIVSGQIVGWTSYGVRRDADKDASWAEIHAIYLHPSHYRRRVGTSLTEYAFAALETQGFAYVLVWVLVGNMQGRAFYERVGFASDNEVIDRSIGGAEVRAMRYTRHLSGGRK